MPTYLTTISYLILLLCFLASCSPTLTKDLAAFTPPSDTIQNSYFSDPQQDYIYKSKIDAFSKKIGGIFIIKKLASQHHRIVFTTEFGAKIFDFEFIQQDFKVNYIIEALDKKILINTLKKDFQLLVNESVSINQAFKNKTSIIYQTASKKPYLFYYFSNIDDHLEKIVTTNHKKEKVNISFDDLAKQIVIEHKSIPLKISLERLK